MKAKNHSTNKDDEFKNIIEQTVLLDEPDRSKKIESLIAKSEDLVVKKKLKLILDRVNFLGHHIEGFLPEEIIDFQNDIVRNLYHLLDHEHFIEYLRYEVRRLTEICNSLKDTIEENKANIYWHAKQYNNSIYSGFSRNTRKIQWLEKVIERFAQSGSSNTQVIKKPPRITNEMVAGFCKLVEDAGLLLRPENDKNIEPFCQKICKEYNLIYKSKVRTIFNQKITSSLAKRIEDDILPGIPVKARRKIMPLITKITGNK